MNYILVVGKNVEQNKDSIGTQNISKLYNHNLEDLEFFNPIYNSSTKSYVYRVSDVRNILKKVAIKSGNASGRGFVFYNSELLTPIIQNALLKNIEDSAISFIFISSKANHFLPTFLSRCTVINCEKKLKDINSNRKGSVSKKAGTNLEYAKKQHAVKNQELVGSLDYENIQVLVKKSREEVVEYLDNLLSNRENVQYYKYIDDAAKQIVNNCKVEACLYNLVYRMEQLS